MEAAATHPTAQRPLRLRVAATFSAATLEPTLRFWIDALELPFRLEVLPPGQVFAPLFEPSPATDGERETIAIVVRVEDWERSDPEHLRANLDELLRALAAPGPSRLLLFAPPTLASAGDPARSALQGELERTAAERLADHGVVVVASGRVRELYPVERPDEPYGERLAQAPYTAEGAAAIATVLVREVRALHVPAAKAVAVDCDETLWAGVAAEAGPQGVVIDPARWALGEALAAESDRGRLVCLVSRNHEQDVWAVFDARDDLPLRRRHVAAAHIGWTPKSDGLRRLAASLGLGLDSFVFLDDSPIEIAEVAAHAPEVLAIQLPSEPRALARCLRHVWPLDGARATAESAARTAAYATEAARDRLRAEAPTFARYFESLQLEVDLAPPAHGDRARVAELTLRTNQFNCSGRRLTQAELGARLDDGDLECRVARVRDRFGDYGLVGVALYRLVAETLEVDTLLLSCRALGRGVEHRMLADLGRLALERGAARVAAPFVPTARNRPAQSFLEAALREAPAGGDGSRVFALPAAEAAAVRFDPEAAPAAESVAESAAAAIDPDSRSTPHPLLARIPHELADARSIVAAVEAAARAARSAAAAARASKSPASSRPQTALERVLAELWREVLGVEVGADDGFFAAGGDSIHAVSLALLIRERLGVELPLGILLEEPTVASLARRLVAEGQVDEEEIRQVLDEVDRLSDEEVEAALRTSSDPGVYSAAAAGTRPAGEDGRGELSPVSEPTRASATLVWSTCATEAAAEPEPPAVTTIAVITADRPEALGAVVSSWRDHLRRLGREVDLLVSDDSASPAGEASSRAVLESAARAWPGTVRHAGRGERARLAERLGACGIPPDVAHFALLDPLGAGHSCGAARNGVTLWALGSLVFAVDDDTLCRPAEPPRPARGVSLRAGRPPGDVWTYASREQALATAGESSADVLAAHERLLGRSGAAVVRREAAGPGTVDTGERTSALAARVAAGGRVAMTVSGLLGDCGWGAPFGVWRHPLGFLLLEGDSLERLIASDETYRETTTRREILRVVDRPTLADDAGAMTTFVGLDDRHGLPPFVPVRRGQDLVMGATLWHTSTSLYGHVPLALLHAAEGRRPFVPAEVRRTAGALDTAKLTLLVLEQAAAQGDGGPLDVAALGRRVSAIAALPRADFEEQLVATLRREADRHAALVDQAILTAPRALASWAGDLREFVAHERAAVEREEAVVPLDLVEGRDRDGARALGQDLVRRFGELLEWWPEITRLVERQALARLDGR